MPYKQPIKLRTAPQYSFQTGIPPQITRFNQPERGIVGVIHDVVAMRAGVEALGHGFQADMKTLYKMAELGNGGPGYQGNTVWGRLGHPGMSENATGKKILEAHNFRVVNDELIYDAHLLASSRLSPAFQGDKPPYEWLFFIAENNPKEVASSACVYSDFVWTFADGSERVIEDDPYFINESDRPPDALTALPVMRPVIFENVDIVNEGALTYNGMFEKAFLGTSSHWLNQFWPALDEFRETFGISLEDLPRIAEESIEKYLSARGVIGGLEMSKVKKGLGRNFASRKRLEGGELLPPVVETEETAPPETEESDPESELLDDLLLEAEESDPENDGENEESDGEYDDELAVAQAEITRLTGLVSKLVNHAELTNRRLAAIEAEVNAINSEPFVKTSVPKTPPIRSAIASGGTRQLLTPKPPARISAPPSNGNILNRMTDNPFQNGITPELLEEMATNPALVMQLDLARAKAMGKG